MSVPVLFDRAGVFTATAWLNDVCVGTLVVSVVQVDFEGPVACQLGYQREKDVVVYGPAEGIFFTADDPTLLQVNVKTQTVLGVRLYLKPLKAGKPVLQARLGSVSGPIIAQQEIDVFALSVIGGGGGVYDMETGETLVSIVMTPYIPDIDFGFAMFAHYATFEDGTTTISKRSNEFTLGPDAGGVTVGACDLTIYLAASDDTSCFGVEAKQKEVKISYTEVNSTKCGFAIPDAVCVEVGKPGSVTVLVDPLNYKKHPADGEPIVHGIGIQKNDGSRVYLAPAPGSHDCKKGIVSFPLKFTANDKPGWYDVLIKGVPFSKRILIVRLHIEKAEIDDASKVSQYHPLTDTTRTVLPGQQIRLKVVFEPEEVEVDPATGWAWTLPPKVFKKYEAEKTSGKLTPMVADDLAGQYVRFYWADAGDNREVKCTVTIMGQSFETKEVLHVKKPFCELSALCITGVMLRQIDGHQRFGLVGEAQDINYGLISGIKFIGNVLLPSGFSEGKWGIWQTVVPDDWVYDKRGAGGAERPLQCDKNGGSRIDILDTEGWTTGSGVKTKSDMPGFNRLDEYADWCRVECKQDNFKTYVMFKPSGADGYVAWVSLTSVDWWWKGVAANAGCDATANWTKTSGDNHVGAAIEDSTQPQWNGNVSLPLPKFLPQNP